MMNDKNKTPLAEAYFRFLQLAKAVQSENESLAMDANERALLDVALLGAAERAWVDAYHARVLAEIAPLCDAATAAWLRGACAPLQG